MISVLPWPVNIFLKSLLSLFSDGEVGQPREVDELIFGGQLKDGFFIEAGSADGERHSDTLYFEINHGWSGLFGNFLFEI